MKKSESFWWTSLYNTLYLLTMTSEENKQVKEINPLFYDGLAIEIEDGLYNALNEAALRSYQKWDWLTEEEINELMKFKSHIEKIESEFWNEQDILKKVEWEVARAWAKKIFQQLKFQKEGFDTSMTKIIYYDDPESSSR